MGMEMGMKKTMLTMLITSITFSLLYISSKLSNSYQVLFIPSITTTKTTLKLVSNTTYYPVTFAYLISASTGDVPKLKRTLLALYHPANFYLVHLDYGAPKSQHLQVAEFVSKEPVFNQVGNVWVVGKPNLVTYRGPTMLATTLHAMSILLRTCSSWDWFINLSASDYPLVTQDGTGFSAVTGNSSLCFCGRPVETPPKCREVYCGVCERGRETGEHWNCREAGSMVEEVLV